MTSDRFVLLGLARPRSPWFAEVSRWTTTAIVAAEFVKCVSPEELRARLRGGRRWSAALLDGSLPSVDRDLLAALRDAACAPIVIDDRADTDRWHAIGASAVLRSTFGRDELLDVLDRVAVTVTRASSMPDDALPAESDDVDALVVVVCGPGGTGASTVAAAAAQGLAATGRDTVLADLARNGEQSVLHDVRDVVPGLQELVEAHRNGTQHDGDVRALTFAIVERGYALLLGLRRARYWSTIRPRSFAAAFESLQRTYGAVVCDVTADFEGEDDAGSADVEERNLPARTAIAAADVVLVVGRPGVKGVHSLVRVIGELTGAGVPSMRVLPVVVAGPRSPRARAEITAAIADLARPMLAGTGTPSPIFLPARPVESAWRDGVALPSPLPERVTAAVVGLVGALGSRHRPPVAPVAVAPGSLGSFGPD